MILESAGYYQKLYVLVGASSIMGMYTAILAETFQLALVIAIPSDKDASGTRYIFILIISLIYAATVFAAGMNIGKPLITQWNISSQKEKLFGVLTEEQKSLKAELSVYKEQKQKVNSAITIKASRQSFQEIKDHLKNETPINGLLIQIELAVLWGLRVLIQLANLCCGRILANNWRNGYSLKVNTRANQEKAKIIRRWKARYTREDKGFIGIMELSDGLFISVSPDHKKKYKTLQGAFKAFENSPYKEKLMKEPTWEL